MSGADGPVLRIGQGFDVHAFSDDPGRTLVLGGITITSEGARGLAGHSDADALSHAIADAVLGAAGLGDLGRHMPESDPQWAGADSLDILGRVIGLARAAGWIAVNVDCTVVAERPHLAAYVGRMAETLAGVVGAPVNVKATRAEGLGPIGRAEGIACTAIVLLSAVPAAEPGGATR